MSVLQDRSHSPRGTLSYVLGHRVDVVFFENSQNVKFSHHAGNICP